MQEDIESIKKISIFGSTGSIGQNSLKIIAANPDKFKVNILTAHNNYEQLIIQARKFKPDYIAIANSDYYQNVKEALIDYPVKILAGRNGLLELAAYNSDIFISAISGIAALAPTLHGIKNTKILAIANKESIVCASKFILSACKKYNTKLVPVDSEHNALYQILTSENDFSVIDKLTITASGGPFLYKDYNQFAHITLKDALKHPNWSMGKKITIDSATMVNKALELIEANNLFPEIKNIDVVIHPESIVHALVSYKDGAIKSLLAPHDMRVPLAYAMSSSARLNQNECKLDITEIGSLNFLKPDLQKFQVLRLVEDIMHEGKALPIVFNAANEVMVDLFLNEEILFTDIVKNIEILVNKFNNLEVENIEHIYDIDAETRINASRLK